MNKKKIQNAILVWGLMTGWLGLILLAVISVFTDNPVYTTFVEGVAWVILFILTTWMNWVIIDESFNS